MSTGPTPTDESPRGMLVLLVLMLAVLLLLQYRTLPVLSQLAASYASIALFVVDFEEAVQLTAEDILWLALLSAGSILLVILEWRRMSFTRLLIWVFASERRTWTGLVLLSATWVRFYWAPGEGRWVGDATAHMAYLIAAVHTVKSLELPIWSNLIGVGTPYLQYYGFLYFYFAGILDFFVRDIHITTKLSLWLGHLASAATMYLFARKVLGDRPAAFVAALAYVASFWHTQQVLLMGRFPLSLFYAMLPVPFYLFERSAREDWRISYIGWGGISLGVLPMIHPGYGFWATFFFLVYAMLRVLTGPTNQRQVIRAALSMTVIGLVVGAYITLGMWLEQGGTGIEDGVDLAGVQDPSWKRVFLWSNLFFPIVPLDPDEAEWYGGYLGTSLLALAAVGAVMQTRFRRNHALNGLPVMACLALSLLLVFGYRLSMLQAIPLVTALNAGRYLLFTVFFLALGAGIGCKALSTLNVRRRERWSMATIPILAILVDLGPTTFQQPYTLKVGALVKGSETFVDNLRNASATDGLSAGELPPYRVFMNLDTFHPFLASTWLLERTSFPSPLAEHRRILPSMMTFVSPFERYLNRALRQLDEPGTEDAFSKSNIVIGGLHMLNVHSLLAVQEGNSGSRIVEWRRSSPILVSRHLEPRARLTEAWPSEQVVDWALVRFSDRDPMQTLQELYPVAQLIADSEVQAGRNACARIFVTNLAEPLDLGTDPSAVVRSHRVWDQRVEIETTVSERCFARLAYAYFPNLTIRVNGEDVDAMRSSGGFLVLPLEPGENRIEIAARLSPLRRVLLALDLLIALGTVWFTKRERRSSAAEEELDE
jgi:hypothetical protein